MSKEWNEPVFDRPRISCYKLGGRLLSVFADSAVMVPVAGPLIRYTQMFVLKVLQLASVHNRQTRRRKRQQLNVKGYHVHFQPHSITISLVSLTQDNLKRRKSPLMLIQTIFCPSWAPCGKVWKHLKVGLCSMLRNFSATGLCFHSQGAGETDVYYFIFKFQ